MIGPAQFRVHQNTISSTISRNVPWRWVRIVAAGASRSPLSCLAPQLNARLRSCSRILAHAGQIGYLDGSRLGTQTLPHSARTGVPST